MARSDPDAVVAEAAARLPVSGSGGCLIALLAGLGALSLSTGLAMAQWGGVISGAVAIGLALVILRGERRGVVRRIAVRAGGKVDLEVGREARTIYAGDVMTIQGSRQRGRVEMALRDGTKLRVASPLEGFDDVVEALKARHRNLDVKL